MKCELISRNTLRPTHVFVSMKVATTVTICINERGDNSNWRFRCN
jgi:hypothetical protein